MSPRFNLAIDGKPRGCDLMRLRVTDISHGGRVGARAIVMQRKTQQPVQFEISEQTRDAAAAWVNTAALRTGDYLFPGRRTQQGHLSTRQYARFVGGGSR
jgi:hypothetical protein